MSPAVIVFAACATAIVWVLALYPVVLAFRVRRWPRPPLCGPMQPTITALIPVHNGERFLAAKLDSVLASQYPPELLDVIVLSDASTDATDSIAQSYAATGRVRFVRLNRGGKAAALTEALAMTQCEILLLTDVRQQLEPECVRRLVSRFADPEVGVVSGELRIRGGETEGESNVGLYWRYESWIRRNLSLTDSMLGATGPIYAMRRSLAGPLPKGCILDDMWLPLQAVLAGRRAVLADDAVAWDYPTSLESEFVRKVRTQAGLYQLLKQEPRLMNPGRNRLWFSFLSLKLGRLFLPHLLLMLLASTFWLPAPWWWLLLGAQCAFYAVAGLDRFIADGSPLKRLSGPIGAFVTLILAAFQAQAIFFTDPASLWKTTRVRESK